MAADWGRRAAPQSAGDVGTQGARAGRNTPADIARFDRAAAKIRQHPRYLGLSPDDRALADDILKTARTTTDPGYYADKLKLLLDTRDAPPAATHASSDETIDRAVAAERVRLNTREGRARLDVEEIATRDAMRRWTTLQGEGATYRVDRSNPYDIHVHMRVALEGSPKDVARIEAQEDAIEKAASVPGYTVDIEFVQSSGPDVFRVSTDPSQWTTSANWASGHADLAHEAHHLLGLGDRYDYIEAHADNADMNTSDRLYWFREQMNYAYDPQGNDSIMGYGSRPLADDICGVAQAPDMSTCVEARRSRGDL